MSQTHHIDRPDGSRIAYTLEGPAQAPAVVLSNSLATDMRMWDRVLPLLTPHCRVLRYDSRGHGQSKAGSAMATLDDLGNDLLAVMDACHMPRAVVAGVSLGGMTGLTLALNHPERLAGLMACNCRARIDEAGSAGWNQRLGVLAAQGMQGLIESTLERWFTADARQADPQGMALMRQIVGGTSADGYTACVRAILGLKLQGELHRIQVPVMLLAGAQDGAASPDEMGSMAALIAGSQLEVLDPCGHISPMQRPDDYARLLNQFVTTRAASQ
jgi:3-oxoadipate enol-lactonase